MRTLLAGSLVIACTAGSSARAQGDAGDIGVDAVVYGLPLVVMDLTRAKVTNVAEPSSDAAPVNQFAFMREPPDATFKDVVRPNVDTLYASAWLDLKKEPMVLSVPDMQGRYDLLPMLDMWTNVFASPGTRTTGSGAHRFAITGPDFVGTLPAGVEQVKAPTNTVWIIGRIQTNGPKDEAAVHALQDQLSLVPLSSFGKPYTPPKGRVDPSIDTKTPPVEQLQRMEAAAFFDRLALLLGESPPTPADAPMVAKLAKIGVVPGKHFDASALDPALRKSLDGVVGRALAKIDALARNIGTPVNGWRMPPRNLGNYGTSYGERAAIALVGLGANLDADAVYPSVYVDGAGKPLTGANRYVLHFAKGETPPTNAFWSVTMYDGQGFFIENGLHRYALSSWMPFVRNADGSLDLIIQHASPGAHMEANWLPAPEGPFNLTLRIYWPKSEVLRGTWKPPAIRRSIGRALE